MTGRVGAARTVQIALVSVLAVLALGVSDSSARFDKDSHAMMCVCGCEELLGECNHIGCQDSDQMRAQLAASIAAGKSDDTIFHEFQQEYGPVVLASPMFTPFNHVAWIVPPLVLFLGIGTALLVVRRWKAHVTPISPSRNSPDQEAIRRRIRRDTQL